jgi:hypothetical protein
MTCCVTGEMIYYRGTLEYVTVEIEADHLLDTQEVEISLRPGVWLPAVWISSPAITRRARALVDFADFYKGKYHVKVRVSDSPEIPIFEVGIIEVRQ